MGLRSRLRARRQAATQAAPASAAAPTASSSDLSAPSSTLSPVVAPNPERVVEPLAPMYGSVLPRSGRPHRLSRDSLPSVVPSTTPSTAPSTASGRTSLLDAASRMRKTLREKFVPRRKGNGDDKSEASMDLDDVPDISDADQRIAEYAAAANSKEGIQVPQESRPGPGFPNLARLNGVGCGDLVPLAADVPAGARCNDGCVSFVVPGGWVATRMADSFCLFNDLAVGFVRTTRANEAAKALLETDRLQVVAEVSVVASPVFVSDSEIQVEYSSHAGAGKGVAKFADDFGTGACVFALCGPTEVEEMIQRSLQDLSTSVILMSVPNDDVKIDVNGLAWMGTETASASADESPNITRCTIQ